MLTSLGVVVYDWDLATDRMTWGPNAAEVLGLPDMSHWATGRDFADAVEASDGATRADAISTTAVQDEGSGIPYVCSYGVRSGSGAPLCVDDVGRWFADPDGQPATAHGTMRLRRAGSDQADTSRARQAFLAQVGSDMAEAAAGRRPLTLFALTVANLSDLNDALGFETTDRVIETVLGRLCGTMRGRDRFVRYSGNRFALALRGCGTAEASVAAERLVRLVTAEPIGTAQGPATVRLAIGAASAPEHGLESATLLRRAESSLGLAKRRAGQLYVLYEPGLFRAASRAPRRDALLDGIEMLNARRVVLACQPVVAAGTRLPAFHEALLRVEDEGGRIRQAGDVIPALERAGLIHLADARMLELAADHLVRNPSIRLSLNVSPLSIDRPDWLAILAGHLGRRSGIAARLILEVTETAAIRDPVATRRVLDGAKALGVSVAIDDFGAGHTSFRHLRDFPVDLVKIDGAFVQNLSRSSDDRFFVRSLVDLAKHLGVETVAEWVEDEESAALLASWGVDYLQGDHCGRPELIRPEPEAPTVRVA